MKLNIEIIDGVAVVHVICPHLDVAVHERFLREITPTLEANPKVLLDFTEVTFVDSSGIGSLLFSQRHLEVLGGELGIAQIDDNVREHFEHLRLGRLMKLYETVDEGLAAMGG